MDKLRAGMRFLCEDTRMLSGICAAYGTPDKSETLYHGLAQEVSLENGTFVPCERPLTKDSVCDLASLTKLFTSVMTLILVQKGLLSLSETVGGIDPRFVSLRSVSVFDVLSYRVSLQTPGRIDDAPDRDTALARLFGVSVCETPAIRVYSDINAMIIKYVIEAKTGMPYADALKKYIFDPVGLCHTYAAVPEDIRSFCVCYNYEHRIVRERYILRTDTPLGAPHDPKALMLSPNGNDLCGHAGLFSTLPDMVRFAQALLCGELLTREMLTEIGRDRTGRNNGDGTYRQSLGFLCFSRHPVQHFNELPYWMSENSLGLSGFTGNHISIDPQRERFVIFLGNRTHARVSHITPPQDKTLSDFGLDEIGAGFVPWPDGRQVPSSARYVYQKDEHLHAPIVSRMQKLGWL